jgi:Tfp pilus assembly protein PilO
MQSVAVSLQVQGPYEQVLTFITKLDSLSRLLDVGSVNLAGVGQGVVTTAQITTQMFYIPPPAGSTTATTVAP